MTVDDDRSAAAPVTVVVATRNRRSELLATLSRLLALPERPAVVVVDNGSCDGTAAAVQERHPDVTVIALSDNLGAGARTIGAAFARTPLIAFSDDDSWWDDGALARAGEHFAAHPRLGLLAARILVGEGGRPDPTMALMAASPLPRDPGLPGPAIMGFVACGAVVRRTAFLAAGGFEPRFVVGGEETLLAIDLAATGWGLAYAEDVVARHHPSHVRDHGRRRHREVRNAVWTAAMRRPLRSTARALLAASAGAARDADSRGGLAAAVRGLPWALTRRRPAPEVVEQQLKLLAELPCKGILRT